MKKVIIIFLVFFYAIVSFAQSESAKPTFGVKLDREVAVAKIEKETYQDVIVELRSADLGDLFTATNEEIQEMVKMMSGEGCGCGCGDCGGGCGDGCSDENNCGCGHCH